MTQDVRWKQRFENFERKLLLLREPVQRGVESLSALEKEGMIQRFEYALELAWKTLKDYMEYEGTHIDPITPRNVIKEAFSAQILRDGQVWINMLDHRNLLSHTYDSSAFDKAVIAIRDFYYPAFAELHKWLMKRKEATP